jgi:hypothetical protein
MRRDPITTCFSAVLLATSILVWRDLYFFSKVVYLPTWTANLPSPINTPAYLAVLCLLPAAFISSTRGAAIRAVIWAVLVAPLPALGVYATSTSSSGINLVLNTVFNYGWVIGFNCLVPALVLLGLRVAASSIKERTDG